MCIFSPLPLHGGVGQPECVLDHPGADLPVAPIFVNVTTCAAGARLPLAYPSMCGGVLISRDWGGVYPVFLFYGFVPMHLSLLYPCTGLDSMIAIHAQILH